MGNFSLQEVQQSIFSYSAQKISGELPGRISFDTSQTEQSLKDVSDLQAKQLIKWDYRLKSSSLFGCVSDFEHPIYCVVYYGDGVNGYYCLGYVIGCISEDHKVIEIYYIEKRSDASTDLDNKFLPIIVDAFTTYGLYLNSENAAEIDKVALVGPLPGVQRYYKENGFEHVCDYHGGSEAMLKHIVSI